MSDNKHLSTFLPHVNGLRALAILGVVFYHLNSEYCPAGYFGVDVFLVISGFFLFRSLMDEQKVEKFHFGNFWLGKAWRILPSWFVCTIVATLFSLWLMLPSDSLRVVNTSAASSLCVSGYYFERNYDYFNPTSHRNALLHYWYLNITQLLYICAPLLIIPLLRRRFRLTAQLLLLLAGVASFVFYVFTSTDILLAEQRRHLLSFIGAKSSYYHLIPRFWECVAGYLILWIPRTNSAPQIKNVAAIAGLLGILLACYLYTTGSPANYLAVISTILVIAYGDNGLCARVLSWKPLQFIGTISFSLYLWHWPVMALWKYFCYENVPLWGEAAMLLLSLLLGYLAWRLIENCPAPSKNRSLLIRAGVLLTLPLILISALALRSQINPQTSDSVTIISKPCQKSPQDDHLLRGFDTKAFEHQPVYCGDNTQTPASFLLLGDSHSLHLYPGLHQACTNSSLRGITLNNSVVPTWDCDGPLWNARQQKALLTYLKEHSEIKCVLISMLWSWRLHAGPCNDGAMERPDSSYYASALEKTCRELQAAGVKVIVLSDTPSFPGRVPPLARWERSHRMGLPYEKIVQVTEEQHRKANHEADTLHRNWLQSGVICAAIDLATPLLRNGAFPSQSGGEFLVCDSNHLTLKGSCIVGEYLVRELSRIMEKNPQE